MSLHSRKVGPVAGLALALGLLTSSCDHKSSTGRRDAAPDATDAGADRASQEDTAGADGRAGGDLAGDERAAPFPLDGAHAPGDDARDMRAADGTVAPITDGAADVPIQSGDAQTPDSAPSDVGTSGSEAGRDGSMVRNDALGSLDGSGPSPAPFQLAVAPNRMLDLVFLLDNSPSMAPKQEKLRAQFPKLIDGLRDPSDGSLPDLRLAIIDSDLGTGGMFPSGACGPGKGNYGNQGRFQMIDAQACGVTDPTALWLEHKQGQALNYGGDLSTVFSCLAGKLGTMGCGEEHTLQAFEFALVASGIGNEEQQKMLRPAAYLGLVFLSDEDDCSAATNDGIFGTRPGGSDLGGESASLRCATRSHACGGMNLSDSPPGYPTTAPFSAPLASCKARTDDCPNPIDRDTPIDVSLPTSCSPLRSIERMVNGIKSLKSSPEQIFVAGIFGWPLSDADMATAVYKIAPVPNPATVDTAHPTVFDSWPVCYDPGHSPSNPDPVTGFDVTAASNGASSGLRLAAFVDAFADNGLKFSICQPDYSAAITKIANALNKKMQNLCLPAVYAQRNCPARYLRPNGSGALIPDATTVPMCNAQRSNAPCYTLTANAALCPGEAYVVSPVSSSSSSSSSDGGADSLPYGTVLEYRCL